MGRAKTASFLLLFVVLALAGTAFVARELLAPREPGSARKEILEIPKGATPPEVARQLERLQVVQDSRVVYWLGRIERVWPRMKAGEYEVSPAMTAGEILSVVTSGVSITHPFLVREGENMYEIAKSLEARGYGTARDFLALCRDPAFIGGLGFAPPAPTTLEGYLFPDTYLLEKRMSTTEIARLMVRRFQSVWGQEEETRARELGMSRNEIITLASVVEKETGAPGERPIVSGVFHNRLKKRMRLQSDPTIIYGMWERYDGNIRKSDILSPHPFNTYVVPALPVGPIANPGAAAIQATLYPAPHTNLYFVSRGDGTHVFTPTYEEHNRAVKRFQLDAKAREGKSWRDVTKGAAANPAATTSSP